MQQTASEWSVGGVRVSHQTNTKQNLIRNSSWPGDTLRLSMQLIRSRSWGLYCRHYIHTHPHSSMHSSLGLAGVAELQCLNTVFELLRRRDITVMSSIW